MNSATLENFDLQLNECIQVLKHKRDKILEQVSRVYRVLSS